MIQIEHNKLRIPTGGRLTSWLFTQCEEFEFGAMEDKSIQWQGVGLEPRTSGVQVQRPTSRPHLPPEKSVAATGLVQTNNMAAVSLFLDTNGNMAAVTSCEMKFSFIGMQCVMRP